jgi:hypothetical protein
MARWINRSCSSGGRSRAACLAALRMPTATAAARRPGQSISWGQALRFDGAWPLSDWIMFG